MSAARDERRVILCEGKHDCAFWGALLQRLGCRKGAADPRGSRLPGMTSQSGAFVVLRDLGREVKWSDVANELKEANTTPVSDIVHCTDLDQATPTIDFSQARKTRKGNVLAAAGALQLVEGRMASTCWDSATESAVFPLKSQAPLTTRVSVVVWGANAEPQDGVPAQQTLERMICLAMAQAYPETAKCVEAWLKSRPTPPPLSKGDHKAYAASYMAGWHAGRDYQGFFQAVWEDQSVAERLMAILRASGAWEVAERIGA